MLHSTVTSKGQTTIPARVRQALNLKPGDRLSYELHDDRVTVRVHPGAASLAGALARRSGTSVPFPVVREKTTRRWAALAARRGRR